MPAELTIESDRIRSVSHHTLRCWPRSLFRLRWLIGILLQDVAISLSYKVFQNGQFVAEEAVAGLPVAFLVLVAFLDVDIEVGMALVAGIFEDGRGNGAMAERGDRGRAGFGGSRCF